MWCRAVFTNWCPPPRRLYYLWFYFSVFRFPNEINYSIHTKNRRAGARPWTGLLRNLNFRVCVYTCTIIIIILSALLLLLLLKKTYQNGEERTASPGARLVLIRRAHSGFSSLFVLPRTVFDTDDTCHRQSPAVNLIYITYVIFVFSFVFFFFVFLTYILGIVCPHSVWRRQRRRWCVNK